MTQLCTKCGERPRLIYNHSWCRDCRNEYSRQMRLRHFELSTEERKKSNARAYANVYQRRGILIEESCEVCGDKAEKHHDDYSQPLKVRWLCRECHLNLHKKAA